MIKRLVLNTLKWSRRQPFQLTYPSRSRQWPGSAAMGSSKKGDQAFKKISLGSRHVRPPNAPILAGRDNGWEVLLWEALKG